jgi:hypothetical protein
MVPVAPVPAPAPAAPAAAAPVAPAVSPPPVETLAGVYAAVNAITAALKAKGLM